jgi:hypothetical protein
MSLYKDNKQKQQKKSHPVPALNLLTNFYEISMSPTKKLDSVSE